MFSCRISHIIVACIRFKNNRIDEEIDVKIRKAALLKSRSQGSSMLEKLQQELKEYKGILKCGVCKDRQKEVMLTNHILDHPCFFFFLFNHLSCAAVLFSHRSS